MKFRVLYFGDVFGRPGREALFKALKDLVEPRQIDFVVVNGENMCHGNGILPEMAEAAWDAGVDVLTTGNHVWDQRALVPYLGHCQRILRPANYPDSSLYPVPGRARVVVESKRRGGLKLGVVQVMGRVFMPEGLSCPFRAAEAEIECLERVGVSSILVDFHGEASSEKQAFFYAFEGRVSAIVGSHSHVQTADERVLPGGTAVITDVGMTGCFDSVIGVKKEIAIQRFLTARPVKFQPAEGPGGYGAVIVEIESETGRALSIERLRVAQAVFA